ncbi:hypothetical protein TNCV_2931501 [Trichonephila clavipes]|nr:hypothetical protein TNCV_2931501 [Trichonephila clavipes]
MAGLSGNGSRLEVRAVIQLLWAKNVSASNVHSRQDVENRNMSELPAKFFTARIEEMIQNDKRVTLSEVSSELELIYGNVEHIVSDVL